MSAPDSVTPPALHLVTPPADTSAAPTPASSRPTPTPREALALQRITEHVREHGYPPTVRWLGEALGVSSSSTVVHYLRRLEWKGWIVRTANVDRGLRLVGDVPGQCPTCGRGGES